MTDKKIQKLIDRYLEGLTSPDEERLLAHELLRPDIPEDWQAIRLMLGELTMGEAEYDDIMARRTKAIPIISMHRRWIAAAASISLLMGIGALVWMQRGNKTQMPDKSLAVTTNVDRSPRPTYTETADQRTSAPSPPIPLLVRPLRTQSPPPTDSKSAPCGLISASNEDSQIEPVTLNEPHLHYAAHIQTKTDTVPYQDPARVDDYIFLLAEHHQVKQGGLTCSLPVDSSVMSAVYVFPDKEEINLFGRLLQVACWYDSKTPGYHLNFSQQQFFFELKDMRKQLQYRWIAERINGKILLYGTNAPIGAKESSACYQEYRDELMHINSINHKTKEI